MVMADNGERKKERQRESRCVSHYSTAKPRVTESIMEEKNDMTISIIRAQGCGAVRKSADCGAEEPRG